MFESFQLSEEVLRSIEQSGFTQPTEIQAACIPAILEGKDVVGRSKTGSGKTLAFGIPAVEMVDPDLAAVQVLVICPTRELAGQVAEETRKATRVKQGCRLCTVYGGADMKKQITQLETARIVVATPGRLMDHMKRRTIRLDKVRLVVLDEADEMLNMGFRDDIEYILKKTPRERQTVMFSATMPPFIRTITELYMKQPKFIEIGEDNTTLSEIRQFYLKSPQYGKAERLVKLFEQDKIGSAIIFCNTKQMTDDIHYYLTQKGIDSMALHGDMKQSERKRVMDAIRAKKATALVATDVAARGIDIEDIEYVINFDVPQDVETYIHRTGRTGRAGKSGTAVTLLNDRDDLVRLASYARVTKSDMQEHPLSVDDGNYQPRRAAKPYLGGGRRGSSMDPRSLKRGWR